MGRGARLEVDLATIGAELAEDIAEQLAELAPRTYQARYPIAGATTVGFRVDRAKVGPAVRLAMKLARGEGVRSRQVGGALSQADLFGGAS